MITKVSVAGFKTLRNAVFPLSPVTVLVGANNSGKSNFVQVLNLLSRAIAVGSIRQAINSLGGAGALMTRGGDGHLALKVEAKFGNTEIAYEIGTNETEKLTTTGEHGSSAGRSKGQMGSPWGGSVHGDPGSGLRFIGEQSTTPEPIRAFARFLSGVMVGDFSPGRMREASLVSSNVELGPGGENLASVLDRLQGERPLVRRQIDEEVRKAVPGVDSVTTIPFENAGWKVVGITEGANVFRAEHISDGILLFIALSTVSQMSGGSTLVAFEEPEKGIHPRRIRESLDQILRVARSGTQFVLTTHSPVLLNEFRDSPDSVLLIDRSPLLGTSATQLSSRPDLVEDLKNVSLGDLWYSGVLGGVPTP